MQTVAVFGGSGFLGTAILKCLALKGANILCFTRGGKVPLQLVSDPLIKRTVTFYKADALLPETYMSILKESKVSAVIITIGAAPVPNLTEASYENAVKQNGDTCATIIKTASDLGIHRVVLISATLSPIFPKAYRVGKGKALEAAMHFAKLRHDNSAVVLFPAAMYGTRWENGIPIPLTPVMLPLSYCMRTLRFIGVSSFLEDKFPSLFSGLLEPMVPVSQVASAAVNAAFSEKFKSKFVELKNEDLLYYKEK